MKSLFLLLLGGGGNALFAFLVSILIARNSSLEDFGQFSAFLALCAIITPVAACGAGSVVIELCSTMVKNKSLKVVTSRVLVNAILFTTTIVLIIFPLLFYIYPNFSILQWSCLYFVLLSLIGYETVSSVLRVQGSFFLLSVWQTVVNASRLILIFFVLLFFEKINFKWILALFIFQSVFVFSISLMLLSNRKLLLLTKWKYHYKELKLGLFYALGGFFFFIYYQSDVIAINFILGSEVAGFYSAAYLFLTASYLFPTILFQKYYLSKLFWYRNNDIDKYFSLFKPLLLMAFLSSIFVFFIIYIFSDNVIGFFYGERYSFSYEILKLLAINVVITYISSVYGIYITSNGNIRAKVSIMGGGAMLNVIGNVYLIPKFGVYGAVISTFISNFFILIFYSLFNFFLNGKYLNGKI